MQTTGLKNRRITRIAGGLGLAALVGLLVAGCTGAKKTPTVVPGATEAPTVIAMLAEVITRKAMDDYDEEEDDYESDEYVDEDEEEDHGVNRTTYHFVPRHFLLKAFSLPS